MTWMEVVVHHGPNAKRGRMVRRRFGEGWWDEMSRADDLRSLMSRTFRKRERNFGGYITVVGKGGVGGKTVETEGMYELMSNGIRQALCNKHGSVPRQT